jgi:energy-coupling factor transport system substrate-specific component
MVNRSNIPRSSLFLVLIASIVGVIAFLYPFLLPAIEQQPENRARATEAPYLFLIVTMFCLAAIAFEFRPNANPQSLQSAAKTTALLGLLVAVDATLRMVPTFLGASPIFLLIILTGATFGPAIGFQLGTLTLLLSAFLTGGVGPWLPFQMLVAGWMGLTAGFLPLPQPMARKLIVLALFGAVWGFAYGAIMNLWSWPFMAPGVQDDIGFYWSPSLSTTESIDHYVRFYAVTSIWYDALRAIANVVLIAVFGGPILKTLERYRRQFTWEAWTPIE